jgi:beta-aspartyl-peptidase (threonine type)
MRATILLLTSALGLTLVLLGAVGGADERPPGAAGKPAAGPRTVLVIHGGAGVLTEPEMAKETRDDGTRLEKRHYEEALAQALEAGYRELRQNKTSVDAVEAAVRVMEDCGLFNAGRGGAFTHDGRVELDAAVMEGNMDGNRGEGKQDQRKRAGAVTGVTRVKNPISAARAVMEMDGQRHVLLAGQGAEWYVLGDDVRAKYHIEAVSNVYFWTGRRLRQIREEVGREQRGKPARRGQGGGGGADRYFGTVGAVALDARGHLAAGTSTGGLTDKLPGRVGDSPVLGAGTYADDRACGVSCTGTGEVFLRHAVAHDVVARVLYKGLPVRKAVDETIGELPDEKGGVGGLIALGHDGQHAFGMSAESVGMYRGYVTADGDVYVAVYAKEVPKRVKQLGGGPGK